MYLWLCKGERKELDTGGVGGGVRVYLGWGGAVVQTPSL